MLAPAQARCRLFAARTGYARQPVTELCASLPITDHEKTVSTTHQTMKTRMQSNSASENNPTKTAQGADPTVEEIRQRAQEIFEARGGAPGNELFDWLRAEQQLRKERAGTNPDANR